METPVHTIEALFAQLGLDHSSAGMNEFIAKNSPIPAQAALHEAPFWNASQASFLQQMKQHDADWAEIVDQLDVMLRD